VDDDLGGRTFTRRRPTPTFVTDGYGLAGAPTYADVPLLGIKQPSATADAKFLKEGVRLSDVEAFYTSGDISAGDGASTLPDMLVADGVVYQVLHVQDLGNHGMVKALAMRLSAEGAA
jgi:hypothetical protein